MNLNSVIYTEKETNQIILKNILKMAAHTARTASGARTASAPSRPISKTASGTAAT